MIATNPVQGFGQLGAAASPMVTKPFCEAAPSLWGKDARWISEVNYWLETKLHNAAQECFAGDNIIIRNAVVSDISAHVRMVFPRIQRRALNSAVAGGISIRLEREPFEGVTAYTESYLERLVCTNGVTRQLHRPRRFETPEQMISHLDDVIAGNMRAVSRTVGERLWRLEQAVRHTGPSFQQIVTVFRRLLDAPEETEDYFREALREEPGDTLLHVAGAVSRAAVFIAQDYRDVPSALDRAPRYHQEHDYACLQAFAGSLIEEDAALPPLQPTEPVVPWVEAFDVK